MLLVVLFFRLPTSFLPAEDQGAAQVQYTLPPGATQARTLAGGEDDRELFPEPGEARTSRAIFTVGGGSGRPGGGQNAGRGFIALAALGPAPGQARTAPQAITQRATRALGGSCATSSSSR